MRAAHPLRAMTQEEEQTLQRLVKATSERVDVVKRAQAILAGGAGKPYTQAAEEAGYKSGDSVSHLVAHDAAKCAAAASPAKGRSESHPRGVA